MMILWLIAHTGNGCDSSKKVSCTYMCCSYEIQIAESARGQGLGEYMMKLLSQIGTYWKMDKVMLTVFKGNVGEPSTFASCGLMQQIYSKRKSIQILYQEIRVRIALS